MSKSIEKRVEELEEIASSNCLTLTDSENPNISFKIKIVEGQLMVSRVEKQPSTEQILNIISQS